MRLISACTALLCAFLNHEAAADNYDKKLAGTWLETSRSFNYGPENLILEFTGNHTVKITNLLEEPVTATYEIPDRPYMNRPEDGAFSITYTYEYQKMSSGVLISTSFTQELYYHEEDGLPVLSETGFEHDGCGFMITNEYLPKEKFVKGYVSNLSKEVNRFCTNEKKPRGR